MSKEKRFENKEEHLGQEQNQIEKDLSENVKIEDVIDLEKVSDSELPPESIKQKQLQQTYNQLQKSVQPIIVAQEYIRKAVQPIILFQENILKSMQPTIKAAIETQERMKEVMQPFSNNLIKMANEFRQSIEKTLASIDFEKIYEVAKRLEEDTIRFKAIMLEVGFPPHNSIPLSEIPRIVRIYDEMGTEYTKRLIERYMTLIVYREEELGEIQKTWERAKWLEKRIKIINSGIDGHINGFYHLTVPTFLAQIEGILVEGMLTLDESMADIRIKYKEQKNFISQIILGDTGSFSFDEEIEKIYTTIILADFERGKEINSDLSRHAILHGEDVNYGTKLNSLKSILIFDYLFHKLDDLYQDIEKSKREIRSKMRRGTKTSHYHKKGKGNNARIKKRRRKDNKMTSNTEMPS